MMKLHCAVCGKEIEWQRKAIPRQGIVMNLVVPHECEEEIDLKEMVTQEEDIKFQEDVEKSADKVAEAFKQFPFVKKLNEGPDVEPLPLGDRRPREHLRTEVQTSTAPMGLKDMVQGQVNGGMTTSEPGRELEEPDGEDE